MTDAPRLLRWMKRGDHMADWRGWHLAVAPSVVRPEWLWWLTTPGGAPEADGCAGTAADAMTAAEVAFLERLTGHERAALARGDA